MDEKDFLVAAQQLLTEAVDVAGAAELLKTTPQNVRQLCNKDRLPYVKCFGSLLFSRDALEEYIVAHAVNAEAGVQGREASREAKRALIAEAAAKLQVRLVSTTKDGTKQPTKTTKQKRTEAASLAEQGAAAVPTIQAPEGEQEAKGHVSRGVGKTTATAKDAASAANKKVATKQRSATK